MIIRRKDPMGLCLGLLGAGIVTSLAGLSAVISHTTTRPWFIASVLFVYVAGPVLLGRHGWRPETNGIADRFSLLGSAIGGITAAIFLLRAPVYWDARSIWFFHASWFADPSTIYVEFAQGISYSHPGYPPLAPSFGAFTWLLFNPSNDWIAQTATGVLTLAATGAVAILVARNATTGFGRVAVAALTTVLLLGITRGRGLDGYVDGLAALLVVGLVLMAFQPDDSPLIAVFALAAALVKVEALLFLVILILPLYVLRRRPLAPLIPGIAAGMAWTVGMRASGSALGSWHLGNVFPWSPDFVDRAQTIVAGLVSEPMIGLTFVLWLGAILIVFAAKASAKVKRELFAMGTVAGALLAILVAVYLATPFDLDWHLSTSADRLLIHPSMVLTVGALVALTSLLAAKSLSRRSRKGDGRQLSHVAGDG